MSLIAAAEYLRSSTYLQPYSIDAQRRVIREYADRKGFEVTHTYIDQGRSGLTLSGRRGLSELLSDVAYGRCKYAAVLVYDVSRWGRFQDADEAAHYEFLCRAVGVQVHYCAESFVSNGELSTSILKSLRRTMAAEYSRELSEKCFRGQKRISEMGFRTGGPSGYGLSRMAVSEDGARTQMLRSGELKSISNDRVILVPGLPEEVDVVRKIFAMATKRDLGCTAIAAQLNAEKIPYKPDRPWTDYAVEAILNNKKYAGWHVWNRSTGRLGSDRRRTSVSDWIVVPNAFEAIVDIETYERAQQLRAKSPRWTREQLLQRVEEVRSGRVEGPGPCLTTLRRRLVGMAFLRSRRGTPPMSRGSDTLTTKQRMVKLRNEVFDKLSELFPNKVSEFHLARKSRPLLKLASGLIVSVIVCARAKCRTRIMRWILYPVPAEANFTTLICLECPHRSRFYLVPRITLSRDILRDRFSVGTNHALLRTGMQLKNLSEFYEATAAFRSQIAAPENR
jgi:DNA invertase Pin-like site-specific DNA recombinase